MGKGGIPLAALVAAVVMGAHGGVARASTAETQARLAAARPVATQSALPPPAPVAAHPPTTRQEPVAEPPRPDLPSPEAPAPKPEPRRRLGLILLLPTLFAQVAIVRWLVRRGRKASRRV